MVILVAAVVVVVGVLLLVPCPSPPPPPPPPFFLGVLLLLLILINGSRSPAFHQQCEHRLHLVRVPEEKVDLLPAHVVYKGFALEDGIFIRCIPKRRLVLQEAILQVLLEDVTEHADLAIPVIACKQHGITVF